jgi:hypothetical protein
MAFLIGVAGVCIIWALFIVFAFLGPVDNPAVVWLKKPSTFPKAPPWWVVFGTCGVLYHLILGIYSGEYKYIVVGLILIVPTSLMYAWKI